MTDIDHTENPAAQALIAAAAAVDDALPGAMSRVADYLEAYRDRTGTLGRRPLDADTVAELRAEDLHTVLGALEAVLEAHTGPEEPAGPGFEITADELGGVFYADGDLREKVEELATKALVEECNRSFDGGEDSIETVEWATLAREAVKAVWQPIEDMGFIGAAALARAEAEEHEEGCHGRHAAEVIAEIILHGDNGEERDRGACGVLLEFEQNGVGLDDLAAKLDELLKRIPPKEVFIKLDGELSDRTREKLKEEFLRFARGEVKRSGRPVCDTGDGIAPPPALASGGVVETIGTATAHNLVTFIENARVGEDADWESFRRGFLADPRLHRDAEMGLTDALGQLRRVVEAAQDLMGAWEPGADEEADRG